MKQRVLTSLVFFLALGFLWEALIRVGAWPQHVLPSPLSVLSYLRDAWLDGSLIAAIRVTMGRLLSGYLIGIAFGLPLGLAMARFRWCHDTIGVLALGFQTLPSVCWVPFALMWFGQSEFAMLFVVVMGCLWSVALATQSGVQTVPPIYARAARTMGSRGIHTWLFVTLPAALPSIVGGMKQGWAFAWRSLMAAEIYVTVLSGFGLGHLLHYGRELFAMDQVLGVMLIVMTSGLVVDRLLFGPVEKILRQRWGIN